MATVRPTVPTVPVDPRRPGTERPEDRRHLRVVRPRRGGWGLRLSPRTGVVLTVGAFGALFAVAATHALLIEQQGRVDELDGRVAAEQARYQELRLEVARLKSPDRVRRQATEDLGMVPAGEVVWLTPDEPAPPGDEPADEGPSPDTSAARVKPYLEATP
ncbi:MAG TPA: septum formation initiator family protein [Acidimicrobiales bacterium]|nr:septum formation initiator family protein [Acidimicrobiales bacterium]